MSYWFCLTHMAVEPDQGCGHQHRLGPYADSAGAQAALKRAQQRSEEWDDDPVWNDPHTDSED